MKEVNIMSISRMMLTVDKKIFRKKDTSPCATLTKQKSHGVTWHQTRVCTLKCTQITACAMARP
jgi:hypothetical protein